MPAAKITKTIFREFKKELNAAKKIWLPWRVVACLIVVSALVSWVFAKYGILNAALPALNSIGMLGFVIFLKRALLRRIWFWVLMIGIAIIHLLAVVFIPWTNKWVPALAIGFIDSLDVCAILWIVIAVEVVQASKTTAQNHVA